MQETREPVAYQSLKASDRTLRYDHNHWWIEVDGKLTRRATNLEVKQWLVNRLLQGIASA